MKNSKNFKNKSIEDIIEKIYRTLYKWTYRKS